jgi:hypothetical protein
LIDDDVVGTSLMDVHMRLSKAIDVAAPVATRNHRGIIRIPMGETAAAAFCRIAGVL